MLLFVERNGCKATKFYTAKAINLVCKKDVTDSSQHVYVELNQYGGCGSQVWCPTVVWDDFGSLVIHFRPSINWSRDSCLVEIFEQNCLEDHKGKSQKELYHLSLRYTHCICVRLFNPIALVAVLIVRISNDHYETSTCSDGYLDLAVAQALGHNDCFINLSGDCGNHIRT